jgi:hypothetical protein
MLEQSEGPADLAQHHIQDIQGISPHVSVGSSNQPTQFGYLHHLDPRDRSRNKGITTPSSVVRVENLFFLGWHHKEYCISPMMTSIKIHRLIRVERHNLKAFLALADELCCLGLYTPSIFEVTQVSGDGD